jgi:hypothetical protein
MRQVLTLKMIVPENRELWERKSESQEAEGNGVPEGLHICCYKLTAVEQSRLVKRKRVGINNILIQ